MSVLEHDKQHSPSEVQSLAQQDHPTDSHELAHADHEEKGAAQLSHKELEVKDLGWNDEPDEIPALVGGLSNEDLWTLIRRFNKVTHHANLACILN